MPSNEDKLAANAAKELAEKIAADKSSSEIGKEPNTQNVLD
jgi:hypothetical protein